MAGYLGNPEANARRVLRRLVPHRRPGRRSTGRLPAARRAPQGDHHPRRREHLAARGGGRAARPPGGRRGRRASASRTTSTASRSRRGGRARRRRRRRASWSPLPRAARRVQGAGASSTSSTRSRGRRPARCSARAWRRSSARPDALRDPRRGRDRRLRRRGARAGGADVTLIARGAHLAAMRRDGVRVLLAPRRLPRAPRGHRRPRRDRATPTSSSSALKAYSLPELAPRIGAAARRRTRRSIAGAERRAVVVLPGLGGPLAGTVLESVDPGGVITAAIEPERVVGCVPYRRPRSSRRASSGTSRARASPSASRTAAQRALQCDLRGVRGRRAARARSRRTCATSSG